MHGGRTRIGLVFDLSLGYSRFVLRGIKAVAEARPDWLLTLVPPEPVALERLKALRPTVIIANITNKPLAESLLTFGCPLINVSSVVPNLPAHRVVVDNRMIGHMAATHFLDRGLRHFGFAGHGEINYSLLREEGFREALRDAGFVPTLFHGRGFSFQDPEEVISGLSRRLRRWLAALPKGTGLFVPEDVWGYQLSEMCRQLDRRVPDDVAILCVASDDLLCELARPRLSTIVVPAERIGEEAAGFIDELSDHSGPPYATLLVPPLGVITRQSSDVLAVEDPDVAAAIRFIREHGLSRIHVDDVLRAVPVNRRRLERRFRASLNRGIGEEIRRVRIERASYLLATTNYPMGEIARRSGMSDAKRFSAAFREETGVTPTAYRRTSRTQPYATGRASRAGNPV
jgi:LacI family transcriptional regulator